MDLLASPPIEIYGPAGLRRFLRHNLTLTYSNLGRMYIVHELLSEHDFIENPQKKELHPNEILGQNISIDTITNRWLVCEDAECTVYAAAILHSVPSLGYVYVEKPLPGNIDIKLVKPVLMQHREALGVKNPMTLIKKLKAGETLQMPDGSVIEPPPNKPGRKIVILGDTSDASGIAEIGQDTDLLVHESTNALTSMDTKGTTYQNVEERSREHGHSTADLAGAFAKR